MKQLQRGNEVPGSIVRVPIIGEFAVDETASFVGLV